MVRPANRHGSRAHRALKAKDIITGQSASQSKWPGQSSKGGERAGMCRGGDAVQAEGTASTQAQRQEETSVEVRTETPPVAGASRRPEARGQNGRTPAYGEDSAPAGGVNLVTKVQRRG